MPSRLKVEFSTRPNSQFFHVSDGFYYHFHMKRYKRVYFRCIRRFKSDCLGRGSCKKNGRGWRLTRGHNHGADPLLAAEKAVCRAILQDVRNNPLRPFRQLISEFLRRNNVSVELRARLKINPLKQAMRRAKLENMPNIPHSLTELGELLNSDEYADLSRTADGADNVFAGAFGNEEEGTKCLIFISNRMRAYMQRVKRVFADGTFDSRFLHPQCRQIYNIVTSRLNHVICLARIVMQSKTEECYFVALSALRQLVPEFDPCTVMTDNEQAQQNAWYRTYPLARYVVCLWHFIVCVVRHATGLGLKPLINHNEEANSILRCLCALPLLPRHLILRGLIDLGEEAYEYGLMNAFRELFQYMEQQWIPKTESLSVCGCADRTNNVCESDNKMLAAEVGQPHPGVFQLIGAFVNLEDRFLSDIHSMDVGIDPGSKRRISALSNDARIRVFTQELLNNDITPLSFLHRASRRLQNAYETALKL